MLETLLYKTVCAYDVGYITQLNQQYVGPPYCRAEMYAYRVACCPLVSHGENADWTDRQTDKRTDAKPLHYAFRYGRG